MPDLHAAVRTLIVDDRERRRRVLRALLRAWPRIEILGEAATVESAAALARTHVPDLVLLDLDVAPADVTLLDDPGAFARDRSPVVVCIAGSARDAMQARGVGACDALVRPFDAHRLGIAIERAFVALAHRRAGLTRADQTADTDRAHVDVTIDGRAARLPADAVDLVEGAGDEARLHVGATIYAVRESLASLERRLDPRHFARVHASTIVNRARIRELQPRLQGEYVLILHDGRRIVTSPSHRTTVLELASGRVHDR